MEHRNFASDFDAVLHRKVCGRREELRWPDNDFIIRFWTYSRRNSYVASCIEGKCTNCFNDEGLIHVVFDRHGLGHGILTAEYAELVPNADYPDGNRRDTATQPLQLELWGRSSDCSDTVDLYMSLPHGFGGKGNEESGACVAEATWAEVQQVIDGLFDSSDDIDDN